MKNTTATTANTTDMIYLRVRKGKSDVESYLREHGEITNLAEFMQDIKRDLSPDARLVIGSGMFSYDDDNKLFFMMPPTAKVIRYMTKSKDRFDRGYTKMTVMDASTTDEDGIIKTKLTRYEIKVEPSHKRPEYDLHAVENIILPMDEAYCKNIVRTIEDLFDQNDGVASLADVEAVVGQKLMNDPEIDTRAYGWNVCPVLQVRGNKGVNMLSLPPVEPI